MKFVYRREDTVEMDNKKILCGGVDWIKLAQQRGQWRVVVKTTMKFCVPQKARKFLENSETYFPRKNHEAVFGVNV